jgi:cytochrome c peroxidase
LAAQLGGPNRNLQGVRQAPGIRYLRFNTAFFFDSEGTPTGGFFWDGRASSLQVQAAEPFLNPFEMAMPSKAAVVQRLSQATYATEFRSVFGSNIFADVDLAYDRMTFALAQYQKEDAEFAEFSSKYDAFLRGQATLAAQELRGLALFNDPNKGNCAACHPSAKGADGSLPLFTNFKTLKDALTFYVQRDTNPEKFYPTVGGVVQKFNDLPPQYHPNVNRTEAPYNRNPGDVPALTDAEIDDLVVFLNTLSDGFVP